MYRSQNLTEDKQPIMNDPIGDNVAIGKVSKNFINADKVCESVEETGQTSVETEEFKDVVGGGLAP